METSLQPLFRAIAQAPNEQELRSGVMAEVGDYFAAKRWGLIFFDELPPAASLPAGVLRAALSVDHNPVLRYLVEHHAPVHEEVVLPPGVWQTLCPRADHGHVMTGPVVSNGQLVGGIALTRDRGQPAFNAQNLADLSALCLHMSTRLATLRSGSVFSTNTQPTAVQVFGNQRLTPRERQIAELVAQGSTNAQIGAALWITEHSVKQALKRMFRKLAVSSRAELAVWVCSRSNVSSS